MIGWVLRTSGEVHYVSKRFYPGGIGAISRRLSEATPPEDERPSKPPTLEGSQPITSAIMSTYASLHYHIVFSTKRRTNFIHKSWQGRLHEYLGGITKNLDGFPQGIGGTEDHVHLLVGLRPSHCISTFMRELKKSSSRWVHEEIKQDEFAWQEGYSVFSVSADARPRVKGYIANQREHHRVKSFREEVIEMLGKAGVEYDPKYLD